MKFLVDMPLSPKLAEWLKEFGHDAVHAHWIGMDRASDEELLERARIEGRIVVTADLDLPKLVALSGEEGPPIILFRGGEFSEKEVRSLMLKVFETFPPQKIEGSIIVVERWRLRRRPLPLKPPGP